MKVRMALLRTLYFTLLVGLIHSKLARDSCEETCKNTPVGELEKYIEEKKKDLNQRYRQQYHVSGPVGWINDPNGFSYFKGEYHLFYQFYPYDSVPMGPLHWGHVSSPDLVNWKQLPTALIPEKEMCFSGSAVVSGEKLVLMYTGHQITNTEPYYNESQYLACSTDGIHFEKFSGNPVIVAAPNRSPDFRDPKAWKHGNCWYVVIGSKTRDQRGRVLLYRSKDFVEWEFVGVLGESNGELGYMWECPDFFELDGKFVLLISPQGIAAQGDRYKNIYQTGYIIGSFNYTTYEFVPEVPFQELDYGHDIYAAQTMENCNGERYLIAWFNIWEVPHPEEEDGWSGCMTIVRKLTIVNNRINMIPVEAIGCLRAYTIANGTFKSSEVLKFYETGELIIEGDLDKSIDLQLEGNEGGEQVWLRYNVSSGKVIVERGIRQDIRQVEWNPKGSKAWRIFLDTSSVELFCGDGEAVFSSRVFPSGGWKVTNLSPQDLRVEAYLLNRSVPV